MILLSEAVLKGALLRNESRGAPLQARFPGRDDAKFLKTTIATYDPETHSARISYVPVDVSLIVPRRGRTERKTSQSIKPRPSARRYPPGRGSDSALKYALADRKRLLDN